jgi:hypothetical protein
MHWDLNQVFILDAPVYMVVNNMMACAFVWGAGIFLFYLKGHHLGFAKYFATTFAQVLEM